MLRTGFDSLGGTLIDTPPLTFDAVVGKYTAWRRGGSIRSEVQVIGNLPPTSDELQLLGSHALRATIYGQIDTELPEFAGLTRSREAFLKAVAADARECGLPTQGNSRTLAGTFRSEHSEPWHSDDHAEESVRYVRVVGAAPTRGTIGEVSRSDVNGGGVNRGDLINQGLVAVGGQLEPVLFQQGDILRFSLDVHAGGLGAGTRILQQATLIVRP
ncbi:MAG TPA: hypothetical protein VF466_01160 [Candidatus Saccharimonadales bacterium]